MSKSISSSDFEVREAVCRLLADWERKPVEPALLLDEVLGRPGSSPSPQARALATHLSNGVIRNRRRLDHFIDRLSHRRVDAAVRNLLRLALFELEAPGKPPRPPFAVVSEAVNLSRRLAPGRDGFCNALLRNFLRQGSEKLLPPDNDQTSSLGIRYSLPDWLVKMWQRDYPTQSCRRLCRQANLFLGTGFRFNLCQGGRDQILPEIQATLTDSKLRAGHFAAAACYADKSAALMASKWFKDGWLTVQDEGAQLISELLDPKPGEVILDACAAPGGKSTHLAEISRDQASIVAIDRDRKRLPLIEDNCRRLHLKSVQNFAADLSRGLPDGVPKAYDAILLDAPCSGLGVIRRRPDLRWRKEARERLQLAEIQADLLEKCSRWLKPGGRLVYATCTTSRLENQNVVNNFLAANENFYRPKNDPAVPERLQKLLNSDNFLETAFLGEGELDGFFAALLRRRD